MTKTQQPGTLNPLRKVPLIGHSMMKMQNSKSKVLTSLYEMSVNRKKGASMK